MSKEQKIIAPEEPRLWDLYITGKEVVFDSPQGEVKVWVQKLTPAETQEAVRKSRPVKSKISTYKRLPVDHPDRAIYYDQIDEYGLDKEIDLIHYLIQPKLNEFALSAESRIAEEKEWAEDDYLIGLQSAWNEGVKRDFAENPEDPEASRVFEELKRYSNQVQDEIDAEEKELIYELQDLPIEELRNKVANRLIEEHGDNALLDEFRKQQLNIAVRTASDHTVRYFPSREYVDKCQDAVFNKLVMALIEISVDSFEGKG